MPAGPRHLQLFLFFLGFEAGHFSVNFLKICRDFCFCQNMRNLRDAIQGIFPTEYTCSSSTTTATVLRTRNTLWDLASSRELHTYQRNAWCTQVHNGQNQMRCYEHELVLCCQANDTMTIRVESNILIFTFRSPTRSKLDKSEYP